MILLTTKEAAEYIGHNHQVLSQWRYVGNKRLPYTKVGGRVYYHIEDLNAFLRQHDTWYANITDKDTVVSAPVAAKYLNVCRTYLQYARSTNKPSIPYYKFGRRFYYKKTDLELFKKTRKALLNTKSAAAAIGCSEYCLYYWRRKKIGKLPYTKVGGRYYYSREDLDAFTAAKKKLEKASSPNISPKQVGIV